MSESNIVRRSRRQLKRGETDWARVDALTDEDIDRAIAEDPDAAPILDEEWFKHAVLTIPTKTATSMRIDADVMEWFRHQGRGWQTRMNAVLRAYARAHGGVK
ncbi:MAG TPA: BrnA antitoxin family protein [Caulobacteraceae bacterium]|nr:BrnA antitoxin family protein [Caulobacteraceae bacterium]